MLHTRSGGRVSTENRKSLRTIHDYQIKSTIQFLNNCTIGPIIKESLLGSSFKQLALQSFTSNVKIRNRRR